MDTIEKIIACSLIVGFGILIGASHIMMRKQVTKHKKYVDENTFTGTATVKKEMLQSTFWQGNSYRILAEDSRMIKYKHTDLEVLNDLEMRIEPGMKIDFTGYPDKSQPYKIHATEINPYKEKIPPVQ